MNLTINFNEFLNSLTNDLFKPLVEKIGKIMLPESARQHLVDLQMQTAHGRKLLMDGMKNNNITEFLNIYICDTVHKREDNACELAIIRKIDEL
jgi:hypothetical protein